MLKLRALNYTADIFMSKDITEDETEGSQMPLKAAMLYSPSEKEQFTACLHPKARLKFLKGGLHYI